MGARERERIYVVVRDIGARRASVEVQATSAMRAAIDVARIVSATGPIELRVTCGRVLDGRFRVEVTSDGSYSARSMR